MKFINRFLISLAALSLIACGEKTTLSEQASGTYHGWTSAEFIYTQTPMITDGETVSVTQNGDNVKVSFISSVWGDFKLDASVSGGDGNYHIEGTGSTLMGMSADDIKEYAATVSGTIDKSGHSRIVFEVPSVMAGLKITFNEGAVPAE